jgi:hypothetical protein
MLVVPGNKLVDFQEVRLELGFKQLRMVTGGYPVWASGLSRCRHCG